MKKLQLKALSLGAREILSREQLRSITGGCTSDSDCEAAVSCDSLGHCTSGTDSGSSSTGSSSGSDGGGDVCPSGTSICFCPNGRGNIGCLSDFDCSHTTC
jgi:hypothetical protein